MTGVPAEPTTETGIAPAKENPEALVLRARPPRAARFRRGVIIAIAALGSVAVIVTVWLALRPIPMHPADPSDGQVATARTPADTLEALPHDYADVPRLGPPLPGDLGQAILDHQRTAAGPAEASGQNGQTVATGRERRAAEIKAARESGLLVQTGLAGAGTSLPSSPPAPVSAPAATPQLALVPERDPGARQRRADFVATRNSSGATDPHRIIPAPSPYTLSAGSIIAASLITGLRSDLPGLVIAQVTERVFDSATGSLLLIPQGARLIGSYDSVVAFGQRRALIVWQRIVFPDGRSIELDTVPATDPSGYAGLADKVDFHTWTLLKGAAISTLLGVGANLTFTGESDLVEAIRESTQQNVSRAGDQLTSRNLRIQPTITIRPGAAVRLVVHHDLVLAPPAN